MAKNSITDYDNISGNNTDVQSVDISEGCSPSGINNAIREVMADLADVNDGTVALTSPQAGSLTVTGDLTVDTSTLHVDSTNNRVGIGTTSPSQKAHIYGGSLLIDNGSSAGTIYLNDTANYINLSGNELQFANNGSERMRIDSSGNVGIGITSPAKKLHLTTTDPTTVSATNVILEGGTNGYGAGVAFGSRTSAGGTLVEMAKITADGEAAFNTTASTQDAGLRFFTASDGSLSERMRLDSFGRLKINTEATAGVLCINNIEGSAHCLDLGTDTSSDVLANFRLSTNSNGSGGTVVGSISVGGSSTSYNTSSDYRLKENVTDITGATDRLKQLNPVRFNFIADADTTVDGFLAHEVQNVVPEAITGTKDGMRDEEYEVTPAVLDEDGNEVTPAVMGTRSVPDYQGIDQSKLVPLLVATIQELEARIAALESA